MRVRGSVEKFMTRTALAVLTAACLTSLAHPAAAQAPSGAPILIPIANRSYVGINPMGIPFDIFTVEGETGIAPGITLGGVGSYIDVSDDRFTSLDFKFRYYPGEIVLNGFSLGGTVGYLRYSSRQCCTTNGADTRASISTPTLGIIADYNWLLGADHRFLVGTGVGAKRVLASADERSKVGLDRAFLTARFTVGLAF